MAFPIGLITRIVKPVLGLVISKDPTGQDSTMSKNWRPWSMAVFVSLILVSVFTDYELSDTLVKAIGAVMVVYVGGRSYEKKAISKALEAIGDIKKDED